MRRVPNAPQVLFFAVTRGLVTAYAASLREAGFDVQCVHRAKKASDLISRHGYDLFLVGSRVAEDERNRTATLFKRKYPKGRAIFLYQGSIRNAEPADAVLYVRDDPTEIARILWQEVQLH